MRISDWSSDVCSSDLCAFLGVTTWGSCPDSACAVHRIHISLSDRCITQREEGCVGCAYTAWIASAQCLHGGAVRSEEHTSELQSLMRISYAVFCLKKKRININTNNALIITHRNYAKLLSQP